MAFQQLYYTSCEHGLAGYSGYQFNAVTPGVSAAVMHEIEDRTVYEPPGWLLASPRPEEPEAYPVAFSHGTRPRGRSSSPRWCSPGRTTPAARATTSRTPW